jgi:hypothetical protein
LYCPSIKGEVKLEHVDTQLAQDTELTALRILGDKLAKDFSVRG